MRSKTLITGIRLIAIHKELLIAEPLRAQRRERGAPYLRENGKLSVRENLVMKSLYVLPYELSG